MKYKNKATNTIWLPTTMSIQMWHEDREGMPCLLAWDPTPMPYKVMLGDERVNIDAKILEKEATRALEATTKRVFIVKDIKKFLKIWELDMAKYKSCAHAMVGYGLLKMYYGRLKEIQPFTTCHRLEKVL